MKLIDLPDVHDLPVREKLQLVDELWLSVTQELKSLEVSDEEKKLLDARWATFLRDPDSALTIDQFRAKLSTIRT
jgi:putative addiction module component (TIGR02574 family)